MIYWKKKSRTTNLCVLPPARFFRYLKSNFKKSFGGSMLFCKLNILKQDEDGKWYKPKNQHRIRRFFVYDIFYRFVWAAEWFLFEKYR